MPRNSTWLWFVEGSVSQSAGVNVTLQLLPPPQLVPPAAASVAVTTGLRGVSPPAVMQDSAHRCCPASTLPRSVHVEVQGGLVLQQDSVGAVGGVGVVT